MSKPVISNQEIFDKVATHLLAQGKKSIDDKGECLYRSPDGCKCAVGCLIPNNSYKPRLEGLAVGNPKVIGALPFTINGQNLTLLDEIQFIHDHFPVEAWRSNLQDVADDYGLTMPQVQK